MKANKALKRLAKIETLMSDVAERFSASAPHLREALKDLKAAVLSRERGCESANFILGCAGESVVQEGVVQESQARSKESRGQKDRGAQGNGGEEARADAQSR